MCRLLLTMIFSLSCIISAAQDLIYYTKNKIDTWKVVDINPQYIKAVDAADTVMSYSTTHANVLFVFNKKGDFVVIPKLFSDPASAQKKIEHFFAAPTRFHQFDKIITDKNEVIICTYENLDKDKVTYIVQGKTASIDLSKVALIIFSTGQHKLFASVDKVYKALSAVQDKYTDLAMSQVGAPDLAADNEKAETGDQAKDSGATPQNTAVAKDTMAAATTPQAAPADHQSSAGNSAGSGAAAPGTAGVTKELEQSTMLKLQGKALVNIKQLGDYLQIICQKDTEQDELDKTIEQSLALFITDARIEVSSVNRSNVAQFKIKDYLVRMSMLKYEKVDIQWYNIQYTSQLRKGPDGYYYGTIEFEQRFVGLGSDNSKYEDVTRKSVEVVLKTYERNVGGQTTIEWDVFLGDIGVTVTKTA